MGFRLRDGRRGGLLPTPPGSAARGEEVVHLLARAFRRAEPLESVAARGGRCRCRLCACGCRRLGRGLLEVTAIQSGCG